MAIVKNVVFSIELTKGEIVDARASFFKSMRKCMEEALTIKP